MLSLSKALKILDKEELKEKIGIFIIKKVALQDKITQISQNIVNKNVQLKTDPENKVLLAEKQKLIQDQFTYKTEIWNKQTEIKLAQMVIKPKLEET